MSRTRAVAIVFGLAALGLALGTRLWPDARAALDCPSDEVRLDERGVARCGAGAPLPPGQALTVGLRLDLNRVTAAELALVPGISDDLARRLIAERVRLGGFRSWEDVDAVEGVGSVRLTRLQERCQLPTGDGGV